MAEATESNISEETGFLSLADLAEMNTDEIQTLTSRVPHAGVFRVLGEEVRGKQGEPQGDKPPLIRFNFKMKILGGTPVDKSVDIENLINRSLTQSYTLWPADMAEGIGLLKGNYQKVGLPNSGMAMGGAEGKEPGWLDTFVGHEFDIRVRTYIGKNGEPQAAFDWLKPEATADDLPA